MNIVFILGGYYPRFSATGNCMSKIAEHLSKDNQVYVIAEKKQLNEKDTEKWNNQRIFRVKSRRTERRLRLIESGSTIKLNCHKLFYFADFLFSKGGLDKLIIKAYFDCLVDIDKKDKIDIIIPCCMPIEAVYAGYKFLLNKKQKIYFYPVLFDLYSESDIYFRKECIKQFKSNAAKKIESLILNRADYIFYVKNWDSYFEKSHIKKRVRIEHPLIAERNFSKLKLLGENKIQIIYQGEVNYEIRNPLNTIKFLKKIIDLDNCNIGLHLFAFGNASKEFNFLCNLFPDRVFKYNRVSKEIADKYETSADINIIIANSNKTIIPSKIYECISSGKPIIYFYNNSDEASIDELKNYDLKLLVDQNDISDEHIIDIYNWITNNYGKRICFDDLNRSYDVYKPEYISNIFKSIIYKRGNI